MLSGSGKFASLKSSVVTSDGNKHCLSFFYYIGGTNQGILDVTLFDLTTGMNRCLSASGGQGDKWQEASITIQIPKENEFQVREI